MKAQTRGGAAIETSVNLVVGFGLSWAINYWCLPLFGMQPTMGALWGLGGIFTMASIVRQFILRRLFEWLRIRKAPPEFLYIAEELALERRRQISSEGYDLAHDDRYQRGELQRAAAWYALSGSRWTTATLKPCDLGLFASSTYGWPWERKFWRPTNARRDLVKAGALIIAAIGRLDRAAKQAR